MNDSTIVEAWQYEDSVDTFRRQTFLEPGSFDALVELVRSDICDIRVRCKVGEGLGVTHCAQVIFSFNVPIWGDAAFNGPYGYRAQYWLSPFTGLAANARLINTLMPKLLGAVDTTEDPNLQRLNLCSSLRAGSAKFWIAELPSMLISPTRDLLVERWSAEAERGVQRAIWGIAAPQAVQFEVKSALLDTWGNEMVPNAKVERHFHIHQYGFS